MIGWFLITHMTDGFSNKQHIVFGAGLIGCYLGAVLTVLGFSTRLVCRASVSNKLKSGITLNKNRQSLQKHY